VGSIMLRHPSTVVGGLIVALAAACSEPASKDDKRPAPATSAPAATNVPDADAINPRLLRRFQPLPTAFDDDGNPRAKAKVDLGRALFYDTRLSKDGDLSCNSCHDLKAYGVDHEKTSRGHKNQRGSRNAPTVYNAAGSFAQFWDGRAPNVEEQAKGP